MTTNNVFIIRLCKSQFLSSSLDVSTSPQDAWTSFQERLPSLLYAHFVISLGRKNIFYSVFSLSFH